jgi:hypothetical protein
MEDSNVNMRVAWWCDFSETTIKKRLLMVSGSVGPPVKLARC